MSEEDREVNKAKDREQEEVSGYQTPNTYTPRQPCPLVKVCVIASDIVSSLTFVSRYCFGMSKLSTK